MALDQSALLNLPGDLKLTDRIRVATKTLYARAGGQRSQRPLIGLCAPLGCVVI